MLLRFATICTAFAAGVTAAWPNAPFTTKGRYIINSVGQNVIYAGTNWAGHNDAMIPEGLQYQSIQSIVSKIKSLDMNVVRLTFAIEMIDDILSNSPDSALGNSLNKALGPINGPKVLAQILQNNPSFTAATTRLQVFDAVAAELNRQQIMLHLDNHISTGEWCCGGGDENSWFESPAFSVSNWRRGLAYMANHAQSWPAFVSQSLRNELRDPRDSSLNYGWDGWYYNMIAGADAIHAANPSPLIVFSGLNFDTDLADVTAGRPLTETGVAFDINSFPYANKIVFELHNYNNDLRDADCTTFNMYNSGYNAMDESSTTTAKNIAPVIMTEFGFANTGTEYLRPYAQCIQYYLTNLAGGPGGWIFWQVGGSYVSQLP